MCAKYKQNIYHFLVNLRIKKKQCIGNFFELSEKNYRFLIAKIDSLVWVDKINRVKNKQLNHCENINQKRVKDSKPNSFFFIL